MTSVLDLNVYASLVRPSLRLDICGFLGYYWFYLRLLGVLSLLRYCQPSLIRRFRFKSLTFPITPHHPPYHLPRRRLSVTL